MSQLFTYSFTSAAVPVNEDINIGFDAAKVEVYNETTQGSSANPGVVQEAIWADTMANAEAIVRKNTNGAATLTSAFITSGGISLLSSGAVYGSAISGFTNANPGVITVSNAAAAGFAAGDLVQVASVAYSGAGTSLNGQFTVASVSGNAITLTTNTSAYGVYVSGGFLTRVSNSSGTPIATQNIGENFVRIGTGVQAASSVIHVIVYGKNSVV